jgi:hypothetical protein
MRVLRLSSFHRDTPTVAVLRITEERVPLDLGKDEGRVLLLDLTCLKRLAIFLNLLFG